MPLDIDECATGSHSCSLNVKCVNTEGTYECIEKFAETNSVPTTINSMTTTSAARSSPSPNSTEISSMTTLSPNLISFSSTIKTSIAITDAKTTYAEQGNATFLVLRKTWFAGTKNSPAKPGTGFLCDAKDTMMYVMHVML